MSVTEWDILAAMGWRVVEVDGLTDHGCLVRSQMLALVRTGLDDDQRDEVGARLLSRALSRDGLPRQGLRAP